MELPRRPRRAPPESRGGFQNASADASVAPSWPKTAKMASKFAQDGPRWPPRQPKRALHAF
eukprot:7174148-Pyramimonas_sp.AAC.1